MALFLRQGAHGVGEGQRIDEVPEGEGPLKTLNGVSFQECPIGDLRVQRSTLLCCDSRGPAPAGLAFQLCQFAHVRPTPDLVEAPNDPEKRYTLNLAYWNMAYWPGSVAR